MAAGDMDLRRTLVVDVSGLDDSTVQRLREAVAAALADTAEAGVPRSVLGWTPEAAGELLSRLRRRRRPVQLQAIRFAAAHGGYITREQLYREANLDPGRALNGITRPVSGIMSQLREEGLIPGDASHPLMPYYDARNAAYQKAMGLRMEPALAELFASVVHELPAGP